MHNRHIIQSQEGFVVGNLFVDCREKEMGTSRACMLLIRIVWCARVGDKSRDPFEFLNLATTVNVPYATGWLTERERDKSSWW